MSQDLRLTLPELSLSKIHFGDIYFPYHLELKLREPEFVDFQFSPAPPEPSLLWTGSPKQDSFFLWNPPPNISGIGRTRPREKPESEGFWCDAAPTAAGVSLISGIIFMGTALGEFGPEELHEDNRDWILGLSGGGLFLAGIGFSGVSLACTGDLVL